MPIHHNSEIDPTAKISDDVTIGPGVVIGSCSEIEVGVEIGPNVVIGPNTHVGPEVRIYPGVVIGMDPQDMKYDGSDTYCEIGARTVIREFVTIHRGTKATGRTTVGSDSYLMCYSHVAHDCRVGNNVTIANGVNMGGHCVIEDKAVVGGLTAMHQFTRVGTMAMVGGTSGLRRDAPPFMITAGPAPAKVYGLNTIGLRRNGLSREVRDEIKKAYRLLYRSDYNFKNALSLIENNLEQFEHITRILEFFASSKRGVATGHKSLRSDPFEMETNEV